MQAGTGVRPNFSCTVCHTQYEGLYDFKGHLESQEHELAYGIRLRNSMVGSYFCNCCHICVNTLLIWKSHIMGTKHMKIACAFSLAYSNFDFDKPAKIKDVGVLDQNVVVPESLQRSNGRPSALVRQIDSDTVVIGVTDMIYTGPGLYHCNLCDEPFNEGNKGQHVCSCRHRTNVFKRWDMALYEEAMSVKEVGKPEYSARCESIASEIFPVEQQVLSAEKKLLYERLMGTSSVLDDQYFAEELARGGPGVAANSPRPPPAHSPGARGPRDYDRAVSNERYRPPDDYAGPPPKSRYQENQFNRDRFAPPEDRSRAGPPPGRYGYREGGRGGRGGRGDRGPGREGDFFHKNQGRYPDNPRGRHNPPPPPQPPRQVSLDSDIKCDLALESVRVLMQNLNTFVSETRNTSFTRVEVLKAQILYEEVLKMAYPHAQKAHTDENYITVFHNGRLTLKRKEEPPKKAPPPEVKEGKGKDAAAKEKPRDPSTPTSSTKTPSPVEGPSSSGAPPHRSSSKEPKERNLPHRSSSKELKERNLPHRSSSKEPMDRNPPHHSSSREPKERNPPHRSSSKEPKERRPSHSGPSIPVPPIPHQSPRPMFDPWGRPIMMHPGDVHRMPFFPPPDFYGGYPRPDEKSRESRERAGSPRRGSSPRKRTPPPPPLRKRTPPPPGLEISRDQKRPRSRTPERVVTLKEGSPVKGRLGSRSPRRASESRRSPGRRSPGRRSPKRSPKRSPSRRSPRKSPARNSVSKKSPPRKSPGRKSPSRKSPSRKSPSRRSPSRRSPGRRSPGRKPTSRRQSPPRRRSPSGKSRSPGRRARSPKRSTPPRRPNEKQEDGDGTVFLDEGAYAELLQSLG